MRIAHFSDLHYAVSTLPEVDTCFTYAVEQAIARQAEVAVITGDTTDHALDAHSPALMALARQIRRLADHCPVLMLQGTFSHEPPGTLDLFSLLGGRYPIHVANRLQQVILNSRREWNASAHCRFDANDWRDADCALLCSCIPTMNKANVAASVGAEQAGQAIGHYLADLLAGYAPGNLLARQRGIPTFIGDGDPELQRLEFEGEVFFREIWLVVHVPAFQSGDPVCFWAAPCVWSASCPHATSPIYRYFRAAFPHLGSRRRRARRSRRRAAMHAPASRRQHCRPCR